MFAIGAVTQIFLVTGGINFRKGCNGFFAVVRARWDRDALGGDLYLFGNWRREALEILSWSEGAIWVCAVRLNLFGAVEPLRVGEKCLN